MFEFQFEPGKLFKASAQRLPSFGLAEDGNILLVDGIYFDTIEEEGDMLYKVEPVFPSERRETPQMEHKGLSY
jgi:hypothetical protein